MCASNTCVYTVYLYARRFDTKRRDARDCFPRHEHVNEKPESFIRDRRIYGGDTDREAAAARSRITGNRRDSNIGERLSNFTGKPRSRGVDTVSEEWPWWGAFSSLFISHCETLGAAILQLGGTRKIFSIIALAFVDSCWISNLFLKIVLIRRKIDRCLLGLIFQASLRTECISIQT